VGACYQPIDRSPDQIDQDIAIMKGAGFNVVRMGDLSWDSFEPEQERFAGRHRISREGEAHIVS
jgi:beta-galactosidase